jgi:hypothetical protein
MKRALTIIFQPTVYALLTLPLWADDTGVPAPGVMAASVSPAMEVTSSAGSVPDDATVAANSPTLNLSSGPTEIRSAPGETSDVAKPSPATNAPSVAIATPSAATTTSVPPNPSTGAPVTTSPSPIAMVNLVNLLVSQHVITKAAGDALSQQAQTEAETAQAQIAANQAATQRALAAQPTTVSNPASAAAVAPASDDDVNVSYVPEVVKNQIRDEVTQDVVKQTQNEDFAKKEDIPDWVKRFHVGGDIRVRNEGDFYPPGNAEGSFTNFNAINTGSGYVVGSSLFPQYNVNEDRYRFRLRARLGSEIDLGHGFSAGLRIATGADNSPVTENQTLGGTNPAGSQGGNFSKYAIWLDRAYIKYETGSDPDRDVSFEIGRFDNPFFHTSMIWSDDLAFDGAALQAKYRVADGVTPFCVAGGFPVFNTDLNFSSNESTKFPSEDKYLFATQLGTNWAISKDFSAKFAGAYYYFSGVEGQVSSPIPSDSLPGNTDDSRPAFAQNGNTYMALRNYEDPTNPSHVGETQYFGLSTPFHEVAFTSQLDYSGFDPFHMWLVGEYVKNVAFDRNAIIANGSPNIPGPVNNLENASDPNSFSGGDYGWNVKLNLGDITLQHLWDWNVALGYRYVQSDATIDGFTDSDFGAVLAGTNLQGYSIGGNLALSSNVWLALRWMSASAVTGPVYNNNVIQFDINAKF